MLSPTYGMDGSPKTPTGALILKFIMSYLWGGRIIKDTNECISLENFVNSYLQGGRMTKDTNRYLVTKS